MSFKLLGLGLLLMLPTIGMARLLERPRPERDEANPEPFQTEDIPAQGATSDHLILALNEENKPNVEITPPLDDSIPPHQPVQ